MTVSINANKIACLLLVILVSFGCESRPKKTKATQSQKPGLKIEIIDEEALNILDRYASIEVIGGEFEWTEGPLYIEEGDYLIFSDVIANKIYKWKEGQGVTNYLAPSGNTGPVTKANEPGSNGLLLHPNGHLVLCQHGDRRLAKMTAAVNSPKPDFVTLADRYQGKRFNSPNDAVFHPNGDLYFTDPPYGLQNGLEDSAKELDFQGVYRLRPNGRLDVVTKELKYPNGIALSPDAAFLYVASSDADNFIWMQYELDTNGLAKSQRIFYDARAYQGKNLGAPDGMKISKKGYVFASGPEGIWVFSPKGKLIAKLYTGQLTSNCAFTPDEKTLYMTCDDYVMRLKMKN